MQCSKLRPALRQPGQRIMLGRGEAADIETKQLQANGRGRESSALTNREGLILDRGGLA